MKIDRAAIEKSLHFSEDRPRISQRNIIGKRGINAP
jgi:hypothetical protein